MSSRALISCCIFSASLGSLLGCSYKTPLSEKASANTGRTGSVFGGQEPVSGALVQIYAVSTTADAGASTVLASTNTDGNGYFNLPSYTCPANDPLVYVTATGGNPGLSTPTNNTASGLMILIGRCSTAAAAPSLMMNEATTVASVFPIVSYMASDAAVGASPADTALLVNAFQRAFQYIGFNGASPGPSAESDFVIPTDELYTLADVISACVNSSGGKAGDGSSCGYLFSYTTPPSGIAPTNTIDAVMNIARYPTVHVQDLYNLAPAQSPFPSGLSMAPSDWSLKILPSNPLPLPQRNSLLAEYLVNEGSGTVLHDTSGLGDDAILNGPVWEGTKDLNFPTGTLFIQAPSTLNPGQTWQFAFYNPIFGTSTYPEAPGYGIAVDFPTFASLLCGTDATHVCIASSSLKSPKAQRIWDFNTDGTEPADFFPVGWHVLTYICGSTVGSNTYKTHVMVDGTEVSSYLKQGANACPIASSGNFIFGGSTFYNGIGFMGKIGGVWSWNTALSLSDASSAASSAMSLLQQKGVQTTFANFTVTAPQILGGIDSRTYGDPTVGVPASKEWITQMALTDSSYAKVNLASYGASVIDTCVQFDLLYGPYLNGNTFPTITVLWGGLVDYALPVSTIASGLQCLVQKAKAAGSRVVIATELGDKSNQSSAGDQVKDQLDPIIRANAMAWGADNIADLATNPMLGADGASSNTNCFPDSVHPGPNCEPLVTSIMQNAVNELLGSTASSHHATSAAAYQELAGDDDLDLTGSNQTVTLPSCIGYSLPRTMSNVGSGESTVTTLNSEMFTGSTSIGVNEVAVISPVPEAVQAGGCSWSRTQ